MTSNRGSRVAIVGMAAAAMALAGAGSARAQNCAASTSWFSNPSIPTEVTGGTAANNCAFHQFAWQAFIAMVQPSTTSPGERVFETWMPDYGVFVTSGQPLPWGKEPPTPCPNDAPTATDRFFVPRVMKTDNAAINPNHTDQAFGGALYDQKKNVVYYESWMNKTEYDFITGCQLYNKGCIAASPKNIALPAGSIEIKTSWRTFPRGQGPAGFYTVDGVVGKDCQPVTVALVGFHLVANTPDHPEFIWATFEHKDNAPDCTNPLSPTGPSWSFNNPACKDCPPNKPGTNPTQVCRVNPWGGGSTENVANIQSLDRSVFSTLSNLVNTQPQKYRDMAVWLNYYLTGNIWTLDGQLPPTTSNARGSLIAANTTMESFAQNMSCFTCHKMDASSAFKNATAPAGLSHFFFEAAQSGGCNAGKGPMPAACPAKTSAAAGLLQPSHDAAPALVSPRAAAPQR